jgi:hypothetical protein
MAPPGGFFNPLIRRVAVETGLRVIRTMHWGHNRRPDFTALECIPINHFLTESDFRGILKGRNFPLVYRAKQVAKRVVPGRVYETIRGVLFGLMGRN